jgi:hypothetical protein
MSEMNEIKNVDILAVIASSKLLLLEKLERSMKGLYDEFEKSDDFDIDMHLKEQQNCIADIDKLDAHFKTILQTLDEEPHKVVSSIIDGSDLQNIPAWAGSLSQIIKKQRAIWLSLKEINGNNIIHAQKLSAKFRAEIKTENKRKFIQQHYASNITASPGNGIKKHPMRTRFLSIV